MKIEVKNLSKSYNNNYIFKDVNMTFDSGKAYGLIGRNGSGKSVFLKSICGFVIPDTGEVIVDGINLFERDCFIPEARAIIERPTFIEDLTGLENLIFLSKIQNKIGDDEIILWLKKVGLYEDMNKKYSKYSLGMKQKLALVQVLMENPKIMILDEPFNGLDKASYNNIIEIFREEKANGKLIIIATHIESDINNLCDEIYEVDGGKITKTNKNIL